MLSFGPLSLVAPWALLAAAILPLLWWLLRVTPPSPRVVRFPAIRLLFGLSSREQTPARTPLWLVLLRMLLALLVILAVAHPLINASRTKAAGGLLLIALDDGWAAARNWAARQTVLDALLDEAERAERPVAVLTTAAPVDGGPITPIGPLSARDARAAVQALAPKAWGTDRQSAAAALATLARPPAASVVWLSDGLDDPAAREFAARLQTYGRLRVFTEPPGALPRLLLPPAAGDSALAPMVRRAGTTGTETLWLKASDGSGRGLARTQVTLADGSSRATAKFDLPTELRNRVARIDVEGEETAAASVLVDERWRRRPVGLIGGDPETRATPLLSDLHYFAKALEPYAELREGSVAELLGRPLAVALLADASHLPASDVDRLREWIDEGGLLVRFAGPHLARSPDDLLPVRLRGGGRMLGGAMSWTEPMPLAPFPGSSPFAGLTPPAEVRVTAQVLAEPEIELDAKTWARLADGTPLVTAERRGKGWLVLMHTTASPQWSNVAMSGLFVDMLRRLVALSRGVAGDAGGGSLPPIEVMDGFGRLTSPLAGAGPIAAGAFAEIVPGPRHPPGFYGNDATRRALNLSPSVGELRPLAVPSGAERAVLSDVRQEIDLRPWLFAAALMLLAMDMAIGLRLRGLLWRGAATAAAAGLLIVLAPPAARAQTDDAFALAAALETRLAYVRTGDAAVDEMSRAGLDGLSRVIGQRSTAVLGEPVGVDVERDPLMFFPLLYWPVTASQPVPSPAAQAKLNDFLRNGGMILFDTGGRGERADPYQGGGVGAERLKQLTEGLVIPELGPVTSDHVLTRAFYLLRDLPGRYAGGTVWVERIESQANDGVSSVVIGPHQWAAAWAIDPQGRPMFAVVPGGEAQREMAFRFGVNLVMYALTGNYKADQVHLPAILERLGR
ncbi:MAG: DUF4159 domain-containing protein [Rhodospirillales bacterium]|nr:DUF4159 domain-containing protein [Rhodospirillales bacterium]